MKRRYHLVGREGATQLFTECGDESGQIIRGDRAVIGKPAPIGSEIAVLTPDRDGVHFEIETLSSGPAQVASAEYRRGWEETFGSAPDVWAAGGVN